MIYIGNDIIEVSRIQAITNKHKYQFLNKIFSKKEIDIIKIKGNNPIYLSGKFAAKEASKKALLSSGVVENYSFKKIQIFNKENGAPYIDLIDSLSINIKNFQISISHTDIYATAVAVLEL